MGPRGLQVVAVGEVYVVFRVAVAALLLAAGVLVAARGRRGLPQGLFVLTVAVMAAQVIATGIDQAVRPAGTGGPAVWAWFATDLGFVHQLLLLGLLGVYPARVRLRSVAGAVLLAAGAFFLAGGALWLLDRNAFASSAALGFLFLTHVSARGFVRAAMLAVGLWGARALPPGDRRAAVLVLLALQPFVFPVAGGSGTGFLLGLAGIAPFTGYSDFAPIPGDCCFLTDGFFLAFLALAAVLAALLARTWGSWAAVALLAFGAATWTPTEPAALSGLILLAAYVPAGLLGLYAIARHGALGTPRGWPPAVRTLQAAVFGTVFLSVDMLALAIAEASTFAVSLGIVGGVALGGAAAWAVHARSRGWPDAATSDPASDRRLVPYRAALVAQIAGGATSADTSLRLRPLRAELGISDQEHALLDYALRGPGAAAGPGRLEPGGLFLGRYRVRGPLGEGGHGATYLCRDEHLGRDVVIKAVRAAEPDPASVQAVLREARAIGSVKHPNVLTVHDVQQVGDEAFIVMEHMEGGSLQQRLARGPLPPPALRALAADLLDGLGAVHAAGTVHRDVKPSNVLLAPDGRAKLADFGVAHIPGFETTAGAIRDGSAAVGTIRFMSPEHARGQRTTARSDLFSAAATLYEAHTGQAYLVPKPGESAVELQMRAAAAGPFARPCPDPPGLRAWFARALDPSPEARFASAAAMLQALERALDDGPRTPRRTPP